MADLPRAPGNGPVYAALLALVLVFCGPLFQRLDHFGRSDWDQFTTRYETPRSALLRDRQLPLWNPYVNGGTVLLAHPHCPAASPWYLPVFLLGAPLGLRVQVVLFMVLGTTGMAALLHHQGVGRMGCFAGGVIFMMGSHFPLHIAEGHLEWCVLGLMPWLLFAFLKGQTSRRLLIAAGVLLASILTFGAVYIPAVFLPCFAVWAVLESIKERRLKPVVLGGGLLAVALPLSAVKLLPLLEFTGGFPRPTVSEGFSPRGLPAVFFDPRQELLYRAFRDIYVPPRHREFKTIPDWQSLPIATRLAERGFHWGWHEYGCYITWLGMGLAAVGVFVSWKSQWPLYAVGLLALVTALGNGSPVDVYAVLQKLPLYASMHVPSRFLAFVLFALAVAAGHGLGWLGKKSESSRFRQFFMPICWAIAGAILIELSATGWRLFDDIFVCRPQFEVPASPPEFAIRVRTTANRDPRMMSSLYPYLKSNTGVLNGYENLAVAQGGVKIEGEPGYRGEVYLEQGTGRAEIADWTMARVRVALDIPSADRLVLNQNFYTGWRAEILGENGLRRENASANARRLVSIAVEPGDREVEFFYRPASFVRGAWISGTALIVCGGLWMGPGVLFRRGKPA